MLKVRIDLAAFRHNYHAVKTLVGEKVAVLPVIKADAYGHGMLRLAEECLKLGAPMLGVGTIEEGIALRRHKVASPVLLLDGIFTEQAEEALKFHLTPAVFTLEVAKELNRIGRKKNKKIAVHLKFDTGMSRLGFTMAESKDTLAQVAKMKNLHVEGIMTHLASSGDLQSPQTEHQLMRFNAVLEEAKRNGMKSVYVHSANSGAILNFKQSHFTMVRPGIVLYGAPPNEVKGVEFKPVMTVTSRLVSVKEVSQGEGVGYNATYITPRKKPVGVVMGGYADGVNRLLSNRGTVIVRERAVPIVGNVCMDGFMVDLSRVSGAKAGDEVVLLGGGYEETSVEKWADLANTIPYEILCHLGTGPRVQRVFK
ncbi:MAG: alanine racemase [Nitrospinae bacterium]|nr:alanine racemase [Nitrospinota bacterium]